MTWRRSRSRRAEARGPARDALAASDVSAGAALPEAKSWFFLASKGRSPQLRPREVRCLLLKGPLAKISS